MIVKFVQIEKKSLVTKWIEKIFKRHPASAPLNDIFDRGLYQESLIVIKEDGSRLEHLSGFTPRDVKRKLKNQQLKTTIEFK
jgi:hypothetical protein